MAHKTCLIKEIKLVFNIRTDNSDSMCNAICVDFRIDLATSEEERLLCRKAHRILWEELEAVIRKRKISNKTTIVKIHHYPQIEWARDRSVAYQVFFPQGSKGLAWDEFRGLARTVRSKWKNTLGIEVPIHDAGQLRRIK